MDNGASEAGSLWGGRFESGLDARMEPLNLSLEIDRRLWPFDIQGSRAWVRALDRAGALPEGDADVLLRGLDGVHERLDAGGEAAAPEEDIHTLVERMLGEEVGEIAGRLHTGRSRNDQVATDLRLWGMAACDRLTASIGELVSALLQLAERSVDVIIPGYTHLQQGQPVRAAHWALSHAWPLLRDRARFDSVRASAGVLPLGSGALAGCPFPVDRAAIAEELGFAAVSENSMDAVSDRDWVAEFIFAAALSGAHLSRLSEDLVLFQTREFGLLRLPEGFTTGSSLMPQKRNPDVAELARGRAGRLVGDLVALLTLLKGLPTGYNRDLQEDKPPLFSAADNLGVVLPALAGAVAGAEFDPERAAALIAPEIMSTDLADHLVRQGVPFREAHEVIGRLVRTSEERGVPLDRLPAEEFRAAHATFPEDPSTLFDPETSVEARRAPGGTARVAVVDQIRAARAAL